jgi:hypothetical protein
LVEGLVIGGVGCVDDVVELGAVRSDVGEELDEVILNLGGVEIDDEAGDFGMGSGALKSLDGVGDAGWVRGGYGDVDTLLCCELRNGRSNARGTAKDENGLARDRRHRGRLIIAG